MTPQTTITLRRPDHACADAHGTVDVIITADCEGDAWDPWAYSLHRPPYRVANSDRHIFGGLSRDEATMARAALVDEWRAAS